MTDILDQLRSHIKSLEQKIEELELLVEVKNGGIKRLENELEATKHDHKEEKNKLENEISNLRKDIGTKNDTIDCLKGKIHRNNWDITSYN